MANGDDEVVASVQTALKANDVSFQETDIDHATKFDCKSGKDKCSLVVYNSGKMVVQGQSSPLKSWLESAKDAVQQGQAAPGALLPPEIEKFPQTLQKRVENCDGVVVWFFQESLKCYKAGSVAGSAFMLGAASEKAIAILIDAYRENITDEKNKEKFAQRINNKMISVKYKEFKSSYGSCRNRPTTQPLNQDLDILLDGALIFIDTRGIRLATHRSYRILTRVLFSLI